MMMKKMNDIIFMAFINLKIMVFITIKNYWNAIIFNGYATKIEVYATKIDGVI